MNQIKLKYGSKSELSCMEFRTRLEQDFERNIMT